VSTSRGSDAGRGRRAGARTQARERALALLYEADARSVTPAEVLAGLPLAPDPYAAELVEGVAGQAAALDGAIRAHATGWAPERMPVLDRLILQIAAFELLFRPDVPTAVAIDEAIELAKEYSTEDSSRFVNGVLAALAAEARPEPAA
jgi:N utilization substance protein B